MAKQPKTQPLNIYRTADESPDLAAAKVVLRPTVQNAVTVAEYDRRGLGLVRDRDLNELVAALQEQTKAVANGSLGRGEAMLTAQAHTLDAVFNNLARRAALNLGEYLRASETYLKLALRAQSQCRATWEAISLIKNPPIAGYVGQANIAQGPQQVNNESGTRACAHDFEISPNELLERRRHEQGSRMERGAEKATELCDSGLEAMAKRDRSEDVER